MNVYMTFGDRELIEPITVLGPNVANAMGSLGELWGATVILYELAPEYLIHLRITVLDVVENTDTWRSNERDVRIYVNMCKHDRSGFIIKHTVP